MAPASALCPLDHNLHGLAMSYQGIFLHRCRLSLFLEFSWMVTCFSQHQSQWHSVCTFSSFPPYLQWNSLKRMLQKQRSYFVRSSINGCCTMIWQFLFQKIRCILGSHAMFNAMCFHISVRYVGPYYVTVLIAHKFYMCHYLSCTSMSTAPRQFDPSELYVLICTTLFCSVPFCQFEVMY